MSYGVDGLCWHTFWPASESDRTPLAGRFVFLPMFLPILPNKKREQSAELDWAVIAPVCLLVHEAGVLGLRDISISLSINPSIGIAIFPKDGTTSDVLLDVADKAMYRAKQNKYGYSFAGDD